MTFRTAAAITFSAIFLSACSTTTAVNVPLPSEALLDDGELISAGGYRFGTLNDNGNSQDLLVVLSISGGGKRSSAFAYGVLKGLRDYGVSVNGQTSRLLDEIDMITAVSGGSFPAAYYGLYRDKIFSNFERDFLRRDIEAYIWGSYLLPWTIGVPTNERMAYIYDDLMFHGATYADLLRQGRPLVSVNATDISYGFVFPFTQDYFDLICSDLSQMPIARAVAASNGFPILFKPITLKSYADRCGGRIPGWVRSRAQEAELTRGRQFVNDARQYLDPKATRYVHLMDGGIADNLAMRSTINAMLILTADETSLREVNFAAVRRILLISADGQSQTAGERSKQPTLSAIGQIFDAVTGTQIDRYNFETVILAKELLENLRDSIKKSRCGLGPVLKGYACDDVEYDFLHLSLSDVTDAAERQHLEQIPTGLTLPDEDIDRLIEAGESAVRRSPGLEAFGAGLLRRGQLMPGTAGVD